MSLCICLKLYPAMFYVAEVEIHNYFPRGVCLVDSAVRREGIHPQDHKRIISIMISTGDLFNGRVLQIYHVHSFITIICISIYGTCYADAVVFRSY